VSLLKNDETKTKAEILVLIPSVSGSTPSHAEREINLAAASLAPLNFSSVDSARPREMITWNWMRA